jgi:hypothetical protein
MCLWSGRPRDSTINDILIVNLDSGVAARVWIPHRGPWDSGSARPTPADLSVELFVPLGRTVCLLSTNFLLESSEWSQPRSLGVDAIKWGLHRLPPTTELRGKREVSYNSMFGTVSSVIEGSSFWMNFSKQPVHVDSTWEVRSFRVHFPDLSINGERHQVEPILFEEYAKVGIAGFCN